MIYAKRKILCVNNVDEDADEDEHADDADEDINVDEHADDADEDEHADEDIHKDEHAEEDEHADEDIHEDEHAGEPQTKTITGKTTLISLQMARLGYSRAVALVGVSDSF